VRGIDLKCLSGVESAEATRSGDRGWQGQHNTAIKGRGKQMHRDSQRRRRGGGGGRGRGRGGGSRGLNRVADFGKRIRIARVTTLLNLNIPIALHLA